MSWPAKRLSAVATFGNCVLLGSYAASSGDPLPTFRHTYPYHFQGSRIQKETNYQYSLRTAQKNAVLIHFCLFNVNSFFLTALRTTVPCSPPAPAYRCSVAYPGGGFGCSNSPPPEIPKVLQKIVLNSTRLWKLFKKLLNLGRQHPKMLRKKGSKILKLPRFAIVLH